MTGRPSTRRATRTGGRDATTAVVAGRYGLSIGDPETPLPDGWSWTALTSVARLESGHTPSRKRPDYWGGDIPWIGIRDATRNHGLVIDRTVQQTNQAGIANSSARVLPRGTVCLSRTASVGYVVVMGCEMSTSQDFVNWVCDDDVLDWRYLRAVLLAERDSLLRFAHGTTHQTIYFPEVKAFHIALPPLREQRRVARVISAFDDKIASNRATMSAAQHLVGELFAHSFAGTLVGDDVLTEHVTVIKGRAYTSAELAPSPVALVSLKCFGRDGEYQSVGLKAYAGRRSEHQRVSPGDVLVAATDLTQNADVVARAIRIPHLSGFEELVGSLDTMVVRPKGRLSREWLYMFFRSPAWVRHAVAYANGSTVLHLDGACFADFTVNVPDAERMSSFTERARTLFALSDSLSREADQLAEIRDSLLPRLTAGRLRVPDTLDADAVLDEAFEQARA